MADESDQRIPARRWVRDELRRRGHHVSQYQVDRWIEERLIRGYRTGSGTVHRHQRFSVAEIERFAALLDSGEVPETRPAPFGNIAAHRRERKAAEAARQSSVAERIARLAAKGYTA